jgi:hypothetical protein
MLEWLAARELWDEALLERMESGVGAVIPGGCQPTALAAGYAAQ